MHDSHLPNAGLPDSGDELFWTAFQYAVGELGDAEAVRFEHCLADDQRAREALTSAVALLEEVRVAESVAAPVAESVLVAKANEAVRPAAAERNTWQRAAVWFVGGAAACVALFLANAFFERTNFGPPTADSESERRLAFAWGEAQFDDETIGDMPSDESAVDGFVAGRFSTEQNATDETEGMDDFAEVELPSLNERPTAPDWLIAAVAETRADGVQE